MWVQEIMFQEEHHVKLTAYIQEVDGEFGFRKRPAILVLPGGGYAICSDREADPVALFYLKAGYQVFILRYTVKAYEGWPAPLKDYENAMELIMKNAEDWHVQKDKIAVVGFSAGGHLAACAATISEKRPKAAILVYPAILKDIVDMCQADMPYPAEHVDENTCPCFVVATRDDNIVPVQNAMAFTSALAERGITFEQHIYSYGQHGFSTAEEYLNQSPVCPRLTGWIDDSIRWLGEVMGRFTANGFTKPLYPSTLHKDWAEKLSVYCTLGHMRTQSEKVQELLRGLYAGIRTMAQEQGIEEEKIFTAMKVMTVKKLLEMLLVSEEAISQLDTALSQIPNRK